MKQNTNFVFNTTVTSIVHLNDDNDPTVVLTKPTAAMILRRTLNLELVIDCGILEVVTPAEFNRWFQLLYKNKTLDANHKSLQTIADELNDAITNEYDYDGYYECKNNKVTIKVIYLNYGITCTYEN